MWSGTWCGCVSGVCREGSRASLASLGLPLHRALSPAQVERMGWQQWLLHGQRQLPRTSKPCKPCMVHQTTPGMLEGAGGARPCMKTAARWTGSAAEPVWAVLNTETQPWGIKMFCVRMAWAGTGKSSSNFAGETPNQGHQRGKCWQWHCGYVSILFENANSYWHLNHSLILTYGTAKTAMWCLQGCYQYCTSSRSSGKPELI